MLDSEAILPVWNGDWMTTTDGSEIVKVKNVYSMDGTVYMDLFLYDFNGVRLPRRSPALGGPTTFEPSIEFYQDQWHRVEKPKFPISAWPRWMPDVPGVQYARVTALPDLTILPWRKTIMKQHIVKEKKEWSPEARDILMRDAEVRRLVAEADVLDNLTHDAFVIMATDGIKERARDLRAKANILAAGLKESV